MTQHTSIHFLDVLKARYKLPSDYAAHKLLGVTAAHISLVRNGKSSWGDETASRIADLLALPPAYVMACCHAERAKDEKLQKVWAEMAKSALGCILLAAGVGLSGGSSSANAAQMDDGGTHIMRNRRRLKGWSIASVGHGMTATA